MQKLITNVAPLAVMTACTIWCCWTQLRESTPLLAATEEKLPRIEHKLLNPELSPVSERDPFLQHKPAPPPVTEVAKVAKVKVKEEPPFDPRTVLPSIRLDATMPGAKPLAMINGAIYSQGEIIALKGAPGVRCQLLRVFPHSIDMKIEEHTLRIGYLHAEQQVADAEPEADDAPQASNELDSELPEGTPTPDELEDAVADALAQQPSATDLNHEE